MIQFPASIGGSLVVCCLLIITSLANPIAARGSLLVTYEGDTLPENNSQPFDFSEGNTPPTKSLSAGIFSLTNHDNSGSHQYERRDPMLLDDLVAIQFRASIETIAPSNNPIIPGAVVHFTFGSNTDPAFSLLLFVSKGYVRLRQTNIVGCCGGGQTVDDTFLSSSTGEFHTYTLVNYRSDSVALYMDQHKLLDREFELAPAAPNTAAPFQRFQANPNSQTNWDFFRYAIGDDALQLIPVPIPEPCTALLVFVCALGVCIKH